MTSSEERSWDTPNIQTSLAGLVLHSSIRIAAPASLVFRVLRNTETWKDWNNFVPRVNISYQPPDEDLATSAEIEELVRNTSIAGSFDSDLTDGSTAGGQFKQKLSENGERANTPPLKLRRGSHMSGMSTESESAPPPANGGGNLTVPHANGMSAAQKFAAAQAERKGSTASGSAPPPVQNVLKAAATETPAFVALPASPRKSLAKPEMDESGRRNSKTPSLQRAMRARQASLNLLYGEPSIRLQLHTRMTFFCRMNPQRPREYKQTHFVVTEVSRPDDPVTEGKNLTQLTRSKTHTLNRQAVYRIVWSMDNTMASLSNIKDGSAFPKSMLMTDRVHEVRPYTLGDGSENCELTTWELQKGPLAKVVKKKYGEYLQKRFDEWVATLGEHCEGMVGKVDRRDFSLVIDEESNSVGIITF